MSYYDREIALFEAHLQGWLDAGEAGKWAVIRDDVILELFPTDTEAYQAAVERFGTEERFLLRQIRQSRPTLLAPIMTFRAESC